MKVLTALVVVALALVGCTTPPAGQSAQLPDMEATTQPPVPEAPPTPNATGEAGVSTNASFQEVSAFSIAQELFTIRLFDCDAVMAVVPVTPDEMAMLVPEGFVTAELVLGAGVISIAFLVCDSALFGNDTYENHVDVLIVFTNGYPGGEGHGGGVDQVAILAMSSSTRFVAEAQQLGMRTGSIKIAIEREASAIAATAIGNDVIQLLGVASPQEFRPWESDFFLHGTSQGDLWMRGWASIGSTRSEQTHFTQFQGGILHDVLGDGRGGLLASFAFEQMSFLPPPEDA